LEGMRREKTAVYQGNLTEAISSVQGFYCHTLNIAITGESGSGKSSLINTMRGLRAGDEGAAETGMLDTMTEPMAYPDLVLPGVTLWDLPGVGTSYFPLNTYCKQLNLSRYEFFIIVGSQRFRSEHARLVREIQRMGKRFYFVRSKADMDLDASRRQRPSSYNEERILEQIREDCRRVFRYNVRCEFKLIELSSCNLLCERSHSSRRVAFFSFVYVTGEGV
uniref:IRG-type G domain-containing protein n=1 Tax=Gopherus agassizii TaxID=38772 RepID=A0A452GLR5_9SAUR